MNSGVVHVGVNALFMIPGKVGGTETYLVESLRALLELPGARYTLFTNRENDGYLRDIFGENDLVEYDKLDFAATNRYQRIVREQWQLARRVRRARCDVLWSPGYTASLRSPCPQAVSIHDVQYRRFPRDLSPLGWLATHLLVTRSARRCEEILALTQFSKSEIGHFLKVPEEKIVVTGAAAASQIKARQEWGEAREGVPVILCVANSYPHKELDLLVTAFDELTATLECRLELVSRPGRGEAALARALAKASRGELIRRHGHLPVEELAHLFNTASLFVLPSRYEGFGLPLIEALGAGIPSVAARAASLPEVGGAAAFYFEPGDKEGLKEVLREALRLSGEELRQRVRLGFEQAAKFTWERAAQEIMSCLQRCAQNRA